MCIRIKFCFSGLNFKMKAFLYIFFFVLLLPVFSDSFLHNQTESADDLKIWFERADLEDSRDLWLVSAGNGLSKQNAVEREKSLNENEGEAL